MLKKINKYKKIFGITSFIAGSIIIPLSFFPFSIPLIIIGGYLFLNGLTNIFIKL